MTKVYIVTSGDYSSYTIEAVFSTRAKAKGFIAWRGKKTDWWKGSIETYDLDIAPEVLAPLVIRMSREGAVLEILRHKGFDPLVGFRCYDIKGNLVWGIATTEEERAIKVVNEKRGQLIAMGVWGDPRATKRLLRATGEQAKVGLNAEGLPTATPRVPPPKRQEGNKPPFG